MTLRLEERERVYVGETDTLRRRFSQYTNPGPSQGTSLRMRARLLELLNAKGGQAQLEVAVNIVLRVNGLTLSHADLPEVFLRRLLENAALLEVATSGREIINIKGFQAVEL